LLDIAPNANVLTAVQPTQEALWSVIKSYFKK
jgi:hypothetical protein